MTRASDARQDQHLHGVESHRSKRIDLLTHLHRAELGGVGAAGTSSHHDRDNQNADLAQDQNSDHVDDVRIRAELAEMENALLRNNGSDQKCDQQHDWNSLPADTIEMVDGRGHSQSEWTQNHADERDADGA